MRSTLSKYVINRILKKIVQICSIDSKKPLAIPNSVKTYDNIKKVHVRITKEGKVSQIWLSYITNIKRTILRRRMKDNLGCYL